MGEHVAGRIRWRRRLGSTKRTSALRAATARQAATHDAAALERNERSRRIRTAKRDVERALRSREQLQQSMREADVAAGHALRRLLDEGLTAVDSAVLVRLSRSRVKRLLRLIANPATPRAGRSSTGPAFRGASNGADVNGDTNGATRSATTGGIV